MLLVGIAPPESDELEGSAFLAVQVFDEKFAGHCAGSVWITVNSAAGVADQSRSQRTQSNQRWCPRCHRRQCTAMELKAMGAGGRPVSVAVAEIGSTIMGEIS